MQNIVVLPGDGIGPIVMQQALRVLQAVGFKAAYTEAPIGWQYWCKKGNALPNETLQLINKHKIALFGAITSKPESDAQLELDLSLQNLNLKYSSPIVGLRQHFNLDICIRPCISFAGNPLNFIRRGADGVIEEPVINAVVFRQNTECLYSGVEWTNPDTLVYNALLSHPKFVSGFGKIPKHELSISARIFSKQATEHIVREAFKYAEHYGYKSVTLCEKPNVIRETSGLMYKIAMQIQKSEFPDIELWNTNIDAQMMWLTKNPEDYGVIVAGNMFGDIVSDAFAGLIGGLGFAASAQYNTETGIAVFEPTHGSAPKYASYPTAIVNPIAMIEAAVLMLNYLKEHEMAARIRKAIANVISDGKVKTYDMLKMKGSEHVLQNGAASTIQITDAIISKL